jgi:hypothetical protein
MLTNVLAMDPSISLEPPEDIETSDWKYLLREPIRDTLPLRLEYFDFEGQKLITWDRGLEESTIDFFWRFLSWVKERYKTGYKSIDIHCYRGVDREIKYILASILNKEPDQKNWKLPGGLTHLTWSLRPELKAGPIVHFKDAGLLNAWGTLQECMEKVEVVYQGDYTKTISLILDKIRFLVRERFPDLEVRDTLPQVALDIANLTYNFNSIPDNREFLDFIYQAVYPGRNEVYERYGEDIKEYDFHLHYTSCYDTPLPVGKLYWVEKSKFSIDRGVLAEATVKVPKDLYIGPLPYRLNGTNIFPVGEFEGWWDMVDLRNAIKYGVDISIRRQLECDEEPALAEFKKIIENWDILPGLKKKVSNVLHGKMLRKPVVPLYRHISEIENLKGWRPLEETYQVWERSRNLATEKVRLPKYCRPLIGMRILSTARVRHLKELITALERGKIFYGDTDSIFTTATLESYDEPLTGQLSLKGFYKRAYFIYQKLYGMRDTTGHWRSVAAGFIDDFTGLLDEKDFQKLLKGESAGTQKTISLSSIDEIIKNMDVKLKINTNRLSGQLPHNRLYSGNQSSPIVLPLI